MAEQATRIKDQTSGDYIATRDSYEQDAEAHDRVIQLVDMASRQLIPAVIRGDTPVTVADDVDLDNLPSDLTNNLIDVGDKKTLIVNPGHGVDDGGVNVTPIVFNAAGDAALAIGEKKSSVVDTLFKWSIPASVWTPRASQLGAQDYIYSTVVFNGKLYGGTGNSGCLFEWNDVDAWVSKAPNLNSQYRIRSLIEFDSKLYGGTEDMGRLFEWNDVDAWVQVAPQFGTVERILSLVEFESKLYGGTDNGQLLEWNDVDAWVEVAPALESQWSIYSLIVYRGKIYGGTGWVDGMLFKWNSTDAWVKVAPQAAAQVQISSLVVFDDKIYGGTGNDGMLFEWAIVDIYSSPQLQWDVSGMSKVGLHITSVSGVGNEIVLKGGVI